MFKQYSIRNYHFRLVCYVLALSVIGILVIGSAKASVQKTQIVGLFLGLIVMAVVSLVDYSFILRFSWLFYFLNLVLLALVEVMGSDANGATRWVSIAGLRFQPSELSKIIIIIFFAYFFMKYQETLNTIKILAASFILVGIPLVLVVTQPDLSTTIVTALIFVSLLFIAGLSYKIVLGVLAVSVPSAIIFLSLILQPGQKILNDYQYRRIMAWLNPKAYADDAYQQQNSIMAIGSGRLWGKGLNNNDIASVKNGNFISEPQTDFIFAVAGEELGFVGAALIVILLFLIVIECILIAQEGKGSVGKADRLWNGIPDRISGIRKHLCCYRAHAKHRLTASVRQLRSDVTDYIIYWHWTGLKCRTSTEKILNGGITS